MIKLQTLQSNRYKFEHLETEALFVDEQGYVGAFYATFVHVGINQKLSKGAIEVNRTLWDRSSSKRPKGYWVLKTYQRGDGTTVTILVAEKWFMEKLSKAQQQEYENFWKSRFHDSSVQL
ncbi:hypothetical protein CQZ94_24470 [Bacillus sp. MYb209]|uniref:hypothetical protein n=1 Tax=Bacillus sp. MYb209 TaxID=1848605 RepID=UPI000CFCDB2B|nr:hypothetical protein [Bacillus sp. MYb209]PQZ52306.1 hypothetical protein CQZ94_24470 [Bacillus sp. MYb209]